MRRILFTLLACLLMAGTAHSAARSVTQGLVTGEGALVTLLSITAAEVSNSGNCLNLDGLGVPTTAAQLSIRDSAACDSLTRNQTIVTRAFKVRNLTVTNVLKGDSGYICVFTIEVNAVATGKTLTTVVNHGLGVIAAQEQNFTIAVGDKIAIMVANGTSCAGTIKSTWNVEIQGRYLSTDG